LNRVFGEARTPEGVRRSDDPLAVELPPLGTAVFEVGQHEPDGREKETRDEALPQSPDSCDTLDAWIDMTNDEPKSAWELAMERFRKQDAEQGTAEPALTQEQKVAIEECRRSHRAKVAELEIMHKSNIAAAQDDESREKLESAYRRELERAAEDRDRTIARIRGGR
jgi:hypothetical protein